MRPDQALGRHWVALGSDVAALCFAGTAVVGLVTGWTIAGRHSSGAFVAFADEPRRFSLALFLFSAVAALLAFVAIGEFRQNRRL